MRMLEKKSHPLIETFYENGFLYYVFDRAVNAGLHLNKISHTVRMYNVLTREYEEPIAEGTPRKWHDFEHIREGVKALVDVESSFKGNMNHVLLAWFNHDRVYKAVSNIDNEKSSAVLCYNDLMDAGWTSVQASRISELILFTKHNSPPPPEDLEANLLVDVDLQRFGVDDFDAYMKLVEGVRAEYSMYTDEQWRKGRADFLKKFLEMKKGKIFLSPQFEKLNSVALVNINGELSRLQQD